MLNGANRAPVYNANPIARKSGVNTLRCVVLTALSGGERTALECANEICGSLAKTLPVDPSHAHAYTEFTFVDIYCVIC